MQLYYGSSGTECCQTKKLEILSPNEQFFHCGGQNTRKAFYDVMDVPDRDDDVPFSDYLFRGMDCEMVKSGEKSLLAWVSVVDFEGEVLLDTPVRPNHPVTDYVSHITGIYEGDLDDAPSYESVRHTVAHFLHGRILVGHALENDLKILQLHHPPHLIRDTAHVRNLRLITQNSFQTPSLSKLMRECFPDVPFRSRFHDSKEDAYAPMMIYKRLWRGFEQSIDKGTLTCHPDLWISKE